MSALRVGLFTECYRPIQNGIVASIDALAGTLRAEGHTPIVVTPWMPANRDAGPNVVRVPSLPLPTRTAYRLTVPYLPRAVGELSLVHVHSPFVTGWLGMRAARRAGVPLVFTYHTQLEAYAHYIPFERRATRDAATLLTRTFANLADVVVVPTLAMERRLRDLGVDAQIAVVPSGIDRATFSRGQRSRALRATLGIDAQARLVLCVGRLGREKNLGLALRAFARLDDPRARLVVVGGGEHRAALERLAAALQIGSRTTFVGELARAELPDVYASADVFLFTSTSDTQGLVLVEALAAGLAVVAVDSPQTRDVIADAGVLCDGEPGAVAAALATVLGGRRPDRARGAVIAASFDSGVLGARMIALYEALRESAPSRRQKPLAVGAGH